MKEYPFEEIATHNTPESLWIVIDGDVYDVTEWQKKHPGGKKMLQKVGGKDASKEFHKYHDAANVLEKYGKAFKIGTSSSLVANPSAGKADIVEPSGDMVPFGDPSWSQGYPSAYYGPSHAKFRDRLRKYVEENFMPNIDEWDAAGVYPEKLYKDFGEAGYLAYCCPTPKFLSEYVTNKHADVVPNDVFDGFHQAIVIDEIARCGSCGLVWFLTGGLGIGLPPILNYASPEVRKRVVPEVLSGQKRVCLCITEPRGGSDVANLDTTAERQGDHYVVNGIKKFITNGMMADYFSVAVRTGGPGMKGVSMLLIERSMPGVNCTPIQVQGVRGSGTAFVEFDDVKVPVSNLLGPENGGFKVIMGNFNHERLAILHQANRYSRVCVEEALKYAHHRETFGKPLIHHPVIRNKLAQMAARLEGSQAWTDSLTFELDHLSPAEGMLRLGGPIAGAKALATQTFEYCAREASQVLGGISYQVGGRGGKVERLYRDVRALAIPGGSEEIMLDLMIRQSIKAHQILGAKI